jgi:hypothetical protein
MSKLNQIADDIYELEIEVGKASTITNVINNDYFGNYDSEKLQDRQFIIYQYQMYKTMFDILSDYVFEVENRVSNLSKKIDELKSNASKSVLVK